MVIGVTGPLGSGKDTAGDYLAEKLGGVHISGGNILRAMLSSLGLDPKKSALGDFGTFLRTHYGKDFLIDKCFNMIPDGKSMIASGFRSVVEGEEFKSRGAVILYIDAPDEIRHTRISERRRNHDSAHTEDLVKLDKQERASTAPMAENLEAVKKMADVIIVNDGTQDDFYCKLDAFIAEYKK